MDVAGMPVPVNLVRWIDEHRHRFEPPVSNQVIWSDAEFIVMVVRGPNARSDFHVDPGDELFYQLQGTVRVDLIGPDGTRHRRLVHEGDLLLVPGGMPHAPMRPAGTWGVVIERVRAPGELDRLVWFCDSCGSAVHERTFALADIVTDLKAILDEFNDREALRTCRSCGHVMAVPGEFRLDDPADGP